MNNRIFIVLIILLPLTCLAQFTISGRVLNQADTKPVANASVFINNATIGGKTAADGTFTLRGLKPGKYDLVISSIGFDTYDNSIILDKNIGIGDIVILPKSITLNEIKIKPHDEPDRNKYLAWFKDDFIGTSRRAVECRILNPEVLNLSYDEAEHKLSASSYDYLVIENDALGYRIKYLLTDFELVNKDENHKTVNYKGAVQFEELKGSPSDQKHWLKNREAVYDNSPMHFLRSALNNSFTEEGFRVQKIFPERPLDSLAKTVKRTKKLGQTLTLKATDFIKGTGQPG